MMLDIFFPVEWDFGKTPSDGIGGAPVKDAGEIFVICDDDDPIIDCADGVLVLKTSLSKMVDGFIELDSNGKIFDSHVEIGRRLRDALILAARKIDAVLPVACEELPRQRKQNKMATIDQCLAKKRTPRAPISDLVDESAAAAIIDVAPGTLSVWRSTGRYGIPFVKIGRKVRYSRAALAAWLESRTRSDGATV